MTICFLRKIFQSPCVPIHRLAFQLKTAFVAMFIQDGTVVAGFEDAFLTEVVKSRSSINYTYLLAGCLEGLGRSLTSWTMKHEACNFTFLSRSGMDTDQAAILIKDLERRGADVQVFKGDAAFKDDVEKAVGSIPADQPVRGIVNVAMVLRVGGTLLVSQRVASESSGDCCGVVVRSC
jgi:hypothetical protein